MQNVDPENALYRWLRGRPAPDLTTNLGAVSLPFQRWFRYKEAFAPELVVQALADSPIRVGNCVDPFAGSGTTALVCQFAGINSYSVEVSPFAHDLILAKTQHFDLAALKDSSRKFLEMARRSGRSSRPDQWPQTFVEPGKDGRYIFDAAVANAIARAVDSLERTSYDEAVPFFRAAVGAVVGHVSNVVINGKGRRYRRNWQKRDIGPADFFSSVERKLGEMISDVEIYQDRPWPRTQVVLGDSRHPPVPIPEFELAVFSPPYPNSFDYTDVYNLELWTLGHIKHRADNKHLREQTLTSHVQITRNFAAAPQGSKTLDAAMQDLQSGVDLLWNKHIPAMVGAYFSDLQHVISNLNALRSARGKIWIVVGDSHYGTTQIRTAEIVSELCRASGMTVHSNEISRRMRRSPQQGGQKALPESIVVIG